MIGAGLVERIFGLFAGNKLVLLIAAALIAVSGFAFKGDCAGGGGLDYRAKVSDEPILTDAKWGTPRNPAESRGVQELTHRIKSRSWGSTLMQLGLSFGIAMILGSLVKAFLRTMITLIVVVGGALWFLQYKGIIEPFWQDYYGVADSTRVWAMAQFESIKTFLKGSLPSAGAAMIGFGFGLKK